MVWLMTLLLAIREARTPAMYARSPSPRRGFKPALMRLVLTHPMIIASAVEADVAALAGAAKAVATSVAMRVAPTAWDSNLPGRRGLKGQTSERVGGHVVGDLP